VLLGAVAQAWTYPVKSFAGVRSDALVLDAEGPVGDRAWGVYDLEADVVLSAKRTGALLGATVRGDVVTLPDGTSGALGDNALDVALSAWLGRPVQMVRVDDQPTLRIEMHQDNEDERSPLVRWRSPRGRYVDLFALHLLSTGSLRRCEAAHPELDWDVRRFRPNLLVDTDVPEAEWMGGVLRAGAVEVTVPDQLTERCVMITRAQAELREQRSSLRALARSVSGFEGRITAGSAKALLGCYGEVRIAGTIRVGDPVELISSARSSDTHPA
jgi:hypothetical protein